ncbi:MAG: cyclopropane-fatty-acyl-phospholipid synthase family protein [Pseudomonadota bacterium]
MASAEVLTPANIGKQIRGVPLKAKVALRAALALPKGSLTIKMPDGRLVKIQGQAPGSDAVLILNNWNLPRKALTQATIGVGESYMDGDWTSPDVTKFLSLFLENEQWGSRLYTANRLMTVLGRLAHWLNRNTKSKAQKNIAAHYDLGNAFYAQWLDPSMTYSSAIYEDGANDLESAQAAKYRALANAVGIKKGDHVLEIGCGWGGFAEFAASEIGCKVTGLTISKEQLAFARERIKRAGLEDKVDLKFQDYRDERGTYDHIVSIEMFEAVGEEYWDTYYSQLKALLKPGGRAGLQIITMNDDTFDYYKLNPDFIQRYIFPGGMLPAPYKLEDLREKHGLKDAGMRAFPQDYARTLADWRVRFWRTWDDIKPLGFDERFKRMWEFYFHYCEAGFGTAFIDVRQIIYEK